jgi:hypothetical protein
LRLAFYQQTADQVGGDLLDEAGKEKLLEVLEAYRSGIKRRAHSRCRYN